MSKNESHDQNANPIEAIDTLKASVTDIEISGKTLQKLVEESGLTRAGNEEHFEEVFSNSKYVGTALEFFHMLSSKNSKISKDIDNFLVLGLQALQDGPPVTYETLKQYAGAKGFKEVAIKIAEEDHKIVDPKIPGEFLPDAVKRVNGIVFFVPKNFWSKSRESTTYDEYKWLFENENVLANTYFVFGGYELIKADIINKANLFEFMLTGITQYTDEKSDKYTSGSVRDLAELIREPTDAEITVEKYYSEYPKLSAYPKLEDIALKDAAEAKEADEDINALTYLTKLYLKKQDLEIFSNKYRDLLNEINLSQPVRSQELLIKLIQLKEMLSDNQLQGLADYVDLKLALPNDAHTRT